MQESLQIQSLGTVRDPTVSGNGVVSALENLGIGIGGALATVGIAKLAQSAGVAPPRSNLLSPTGYQSYVAPPPKTNWGMFALVAGGLGLIVGLVIYAGRG